MRIRAIKKTYKTKNVQPVVALDGISFDLPEKGMVFILGKSGSGKSTLLNVMSGLDRMDEGSIEVGGKDISTFTEKELSNYRNSCCGFVFQEYNLIPELNVSENIMLTLQLQGEEKTEQKVKEILKRVDLSGYEKRKVTELSGGQKQRIALARAIIKNPKIIFADEPTGALDEQTGRNILDLLKGFSKDKLVVVVSHDREFAEKYGDRIIELADGNIINDSNPIVFSQEEAKENWKKPRLPMKMALKIGCSNFRYHPIRLVATILLSVIAFTFLGVSLNIGFNGFQDVVFNSMQSNQLKHSIVNKYHKDNVVIPIKENEKKNIERQFGKSLGVICVSIDIKYEIKSESENCYYSVIPNGFAEISSDLIERFGFSFVGRLPSENNEVGLTKFSADIINYLNYNEEKTENIIGNYIVINEQEYIITSIIDTNFDFDKYSPVKNVQANIDTHLLSAFQKEVHSSLHNFIYVNNIIDYCNEGILLDKETCGLYFTDNFSVEISKLTKQDNSFDVYVLNTFENGSFISANLIPTVLQLIECNIEYNNAVFSNYGELFRTLCNEDSEIEANTDDNLYLKIYEKYKERYLFPTSFNCSLVDEKYGLQHDITVSGFFTNYSDDTAVILSDELYQTIYEEIGGQYDGVFITVSNENVKQLISQNSIFRLNNFIVENVIKYWDTIDTIKSIANIMSAIFAFFSIGLLLNFLLQSVIDKTKTIGILKANGCNNILLSKILIVEGIVIAYAIFIFVSILVSAICFFLSRYFINIAVFGINILIFPIMLTVILLFSVFGCLFPIVHMRRLLPNDIIIRN